MSLSYENYIKSIGESSGKVLEEMKELTFKLVPKAELSISHGITTFKFKGKNLVYFGAFKDHWSFFQAFLLLMLLRIGFLPIRFLRVLFRFLIL